MKMSGTSRRPHVVTSPRRDVPTSRRWVNYYAGQQAATSRRLNVSASSVFSLFKSEKGENWRYRETYGLGAEIRAEATSIWKKSP